MKTNAVVFCCFLVPMPPFCHLSAISWFAFSTKNLSKDSVMSVLSESPRQVSVTFCFTSSLVTGSLAARILYLSQIVCRVLESELAPVSTSQLEHCGKQVKN